jgi:hypothetical protein
MADIDEVINLLNYGYGGTHYVPHEKFAAAVSGLKTLKTILPRTLSASEFCRRLREVVMIIPDRHINFWFDGKWCGEEPKKISGVGPNFGSDLKRAWEINDLQLSHGDSVPVISIHWLPSSDDLEWKGFKETVQNRIKTARALVIDLRGNPGGDDGIGAWLARTLYGATPPPAYSRIIDRQTPEALALFINSMHLMELGYIRDGKTVPADLQEYQKKYRANLELALKGNLPEERIQSLNSEAAEPFDSKKGFDHPIYVLADRLTGSSAESSLAMLRTHPRAKVIGENTAGAIHFGNQGEAALQESGITFLMGTHFVEDIHQAYYEVVGYPPDIRVKPGASAITTLKTELRKRTF